MPEYIIHSGDIMIKFTAAEDRIVRPFTYGANDRVGDRVGDAAGDRAGDIMIPFTFEVTVKVTENLYENTSSCKMPEIINFWAKNKNRLSAKYVCGILK